MLFVMGTFIASVLVYTIIQNINCVKDTVEKVVEKLAAHNTADHKTGTVLIPVVKLDPKNEISTVFPMPLGSEICAHNMEVIVNQKITSPHEEKTVIVLQCLKCGAIDKTIVANSPAPKPIPPKSECRHRWIKEKAISLNSAFEQMEEVLSQPAKNNQLAKNKKTIIEENSPTSLPPWMFQKKICIQRICSECGEVDRAVVSNFDIEKEDVEQISETEDGKVPE